MFALLFVAICLIECTAINDTSHLIIWYRIGNENFIVRVKGKLIFDIINENTLSFTNKK